MAALSKNTADVKQVRMFDQIKRRHIKNSYRCATTFVETVFDDTINSHQQTLIVLTFGSGKESHTKNALNTHDSSTTPEKRGND